MVVVMYRVFNEQTSFACADLTSTDCKWAAQQAAALYGPQCLELPIAASPANMPPFRAYVCHGATGPLAELCGSRVAPQSLAGSSEAAQGPLVALTGVAGLTAVKLAHTNRKLRARLPGIDAEMKRANEEMRIDAEMKRANEEMIERIRQDMKDTHGRIMSDLQSTHDTVLQHICTQNPWMCIRASEVEGLSETETKTLSEIVGRHRLEFDKIPLGRRLYHREAEEEALVSEISEKMPDKVTELSMHVDGSRYALGLQIEEPHL
tara:strand:- start:582 stop:1373 length:792 start_codon:yes stop_codon:yes gene_type:complete